MSVKYDVEIQGHVAPFKWQIFRETRTCRRSLVSGACGEADTFQDACFDARNRAGELEESRRHTATKETVFLFEVDDEQRRPDDDVPVMDSDPECTASPEYDGA